MIVEAMRMQRLVDDLLTLAKADDQGLRLAADEVDLDDLVDAEVRRVRATAEVPCSLRHRGHQGHRVHRSMSQVLRDLVDNAVRHAASWMALSVSTSRLRSS